MKDKIKHSKQQLSSVKCWKGYLSYANFFILRAARQRLDPILYVELQLSSKGFRLETENSSDNIM